MLFDALLVCLSLVLLVLAFLVARSSHCFYLRKCITHGSAIPGIASLGWPVVGFLPYLPSTTAGIHSILTSMATIGGQDGMAYSWVGPSILVTLHEPSLIRAFLDQSSKISRDHDTLSLFSPAGSLKRMLGTSLFFYNDLEVKKIKTSLRNLVGHRAAVADYYTNIVAIAKKHVERLTLSANSHVDVIKLADDFSADLWADVFLGLSDTHVDDPELSTIISSLTRQSTNYFHLLKHIIWSASHLQSISSPSPAEEEVGKAFDTIVAKRLGQFMRRREEKSGTSTSQESMISRHKSTLPVLARMISNGSLRDDAIMSDEVWKTTKVAIFSGSQSAKHFISWVLYELERNPSMLEALRSELLHLLPSKDLIDLPYERFCAETPVLDAILAETARLHAPSFTSVRVVIDHVSLTTPTGKTTVLEPGTIVMTNTQHAHTSPVIWPDAAKWQPQRFLHGLNAHQKRAYMPNGYGIRGCPGSELSMVGIKAYLILLLRDYDVQLEDFEMIPGFVSTWMIPKATYSVKPASSQQCRDTLVR